MASHELTVLCANVGTKWDAVWVHRLQQMVSENCSVPFQFKVVTNRLGEYPEEWGVPLSRNVVWTRDHHSQIPDSADLVLNTDKPQGCWAKLDFFIDQFGPQPIIALDLDVVILDDIVPLIRKNVHMPMQSPGHGNGSIYSFTPGFTGWKPPKKIPYRARPRGEQEYVQAMTEARPLPDCYSFKTHVASRPGKQPPPGTRIVYFHGRPTPADDKVQDLDWVSRTWRGFDRIERI
jgi:hypothetical protein